MPVNNAEKITDVYIVHELIPSPLVYVGQVYSQKKSKLRNPYFFVSRTRLSVHNIPVNVDEQRLKRVFLEAAGDEEARISQVRRSHQHCILYVFIVLLCCQVKIMRSSERVNSKGVGRSLGYGFVEFTTHKAALATLRATNNNPKMFGEKKVRCVLPFSCEHIATQSDAHVHVTCMTHAPHLVSGATVRGAHCRQADLYYTRTTYSPYQYNAADHNLYKSE